MDIPDRHGPIGLFDSGVGGITILQAIQQLLPNEEVVMVGDQAHVPYGTRSLEEVRSFSVAVTDYLLSQGSKIIVVACNTASAASLMYLRQHFPSVSIVGMEPAIKPASEQTLSGAVGVLATQATFQSELYASVVSRFAKGVRVYQGTCPGLVKAIEAGKLDDGETRAILERALSPMLAANIDTIVLGCTHYPFITPLIRKIAGDAVRIIDPAPAIARQVNHLLEVQHLHTDQVGKPSYRVLTTGSLQNLNDILNKLPISPEVSKFLKTDKLEWFNTSDMAWELHPVA